MNFDDPNYLAFVLQAERDCRCCVDCTTDRPCAGVLAGGICDYVCRCRDDDMDECEWDDEL